VNIALSLFMALGVCGVPYLVATLTGYAVLVFVVKAFRPRIMDALAFIPIAAYLLLIVHSNRQGSNAGVANLVVSAVVLASLALRSRILPSSPAAQALVVPLFGLVAAVVAWRAIPYEQFLTIEIW